MVMAGPGPGLGPKPIDIFRRWNRRFRCLFRHRWDEQELAYGPRFFVTLISCGRCGKIQVADADKRS